MGKTKGRKQSKKNNSRKINELKLNKILKFKKSELESEEKAK